LCYADHYSTADDATGIVGESVPSNSRPCDVQQEQDDTGNVRYVYEDSTDQVRIGNEAFHEDEDLATFK